MNLVSGNYEFASLVVIYDEDFWHQYGGHIEASWESAGLRLYSSLDRELLGELIADECWSNEGLFALLLGLRRLEEPGGNRVNLPDKPSGPLGEVDDEITVDQERQGCSSIVARSLGPLLSGAVSSPLDFYIFR